jgi:hypothetical protein
MVRKALKKKTGSSASWLRLDTILTWLVLQKPSK